MADTGEVPCGDALVVATLVAGAVEARDEDEPAPVALDRVAGPADAFVDP